HSRLSPSPRHCLPPPPSPLSPPISRSTRACERYICGGAAPPPPPRGSFTTVGTQVQYQSVPTCHAAALGLPPSPPPHTPPLLIFFHPLTPAEGSALAAVSIGAPSVVTKEGNECAALELG